MNYSNKDSLVGALIIAGWDAAGGGQVRVFRVKRFSGLSGF